MVRRMLASGFALLVLVGGAVAADAIEVALKDCKFTDAAGKDADAVGYNEGDARIFFYINGIAKSTVKADDDGDYTLVIEASCDEANKTLAKVKIQVNDKSVKDDFALTEAGKKEYKFDVKLKKGENKLHVEFLNDTYKENEYDLNLYVYAIKFEKKKAR